MLDLPKEGRWVVEIKRGLEPQVAKGFHQACEDLKPKARFVVYSGSQRYPLAAETEAIGLRAMAQTLARAE